MQKPTLSPSWASLKSFVLQNSAVPQLRMSVDDEVLQLSIQWSRNSKTAAVNPPNPMKLKEKDFALKSDEQVAKVNKKSTKNKDQLKGVGLYVLARTATYNQAERNVITPLNASALSAFALEE